MSAFCVFKLLTRLDKSKKLTLESSQFLFIFKLFTTEKENTMNKKKERKAGKNKVREILCFRCLERGHIVIYSNKMKKRGKVEEWKIGDDFICKKCKIGFRYNGHELIKNACGKCEDYIWSGYLENLQCGGESYNENEDRLVCPKCGHLFKLRRGKLFPAPLEIAYSLKNVEEAV